MSEESRKEWGPLSGLSLSLERDIAVALTVTIGIERAQKLRVYERYSINTDDFECLAVLEGKFVEVRRNPERLDSEPVHTLERHVQAARELFEKLQRDPKTKA